MGWEGQSQVLGRHRPASQPHLARPRPLQEHVAAGIILYCRSQGIPLPRDSRKLLLVENDSVSMIMQVSYAERKSPANIAAAETLEDAESEAIAADQARVIDGPD